MKSRNELPKIDASNFEVLNSQSMRVMVGGVDCATVTYSKKKKKNLPGKVDTNDA